MPTTLVVAVVLALMLGPWAEYALLSPGKVALEKQTKTWWVRKVDKERLKKQIMSDEGYRRNIYKDTLGFDTVGYGHLVREGEIIPTFKNAKLAKEFHMELLDKDLDVAIKDAISLIGEDHPAEVLEGFSNMSFQLGKTKLSKFKKTIELIKNKEYQKAGLEMMDSNWANQTPNRAKRVSNMFNIKPKVRPQPYANEETQEQFLDIVANNSIVDNDHFFKQLDTEIGLEKLGGPWRRLSGSISADTKLGTFSAGAEQVFSEEGDTMPEAFSLEYKNGGFSASMYKQDEYEKMKLNFRKKF